MYVMLAIALIYAACYGAAWLIGRDTHFEDQD